MIRIFTFDQKIIYLVLAEIVWENIKIDFGGVEANCDDLIDFQMLFFWWVFYELCAGVNIFKASYKEMDWKSV